MGEHGWCVFYYYEVHGCACMMMSPSSCTALYFQNAMDPMLFYAFALCSPPALACRHKVCALCVVSIYSFFAFCIESCTLHIKSGHFGQAAFSWIAAQLIQRRDSAAMYDSQNSHNVCPYACVLLTLSDGQLLSRAKWCSNDLFMRRFFVAVKAFLFVKRACIVRTLGFPSGPA